jgi:hypothetical protein
MHRSLVRLATFYAFALTIFLALIGCSTQSSSAIGEAYVAPASINLRGELTQKNSTVAVLKHGDRISILDVRRRFVKIRTVSGVEGWIDSTQLLSSEQMDQIRRDREHALALPSEGSATAFEALNVHIEPNRQSPALARIPEAGSVVILGHRLQPKATGPAPSAALIFEKPQPLTRHQRRDRQLKSIYHLPPKPSPPKAPANWQELSAERINGSSSLAEMKADQEKEKIAKKLEDPKKPVILEDWSLVRTKDNQIGWVLTRNLIMSIPDEVAQYAEGKHITSYFDLGAVHDEVKGIKHNWLWTTSSGPLSYDFDAWRVFLWNRRRHRYETSYRQRDIEGYFPVHVDPPAAGPSERSFQLIEKDDGKLWRRSYLFDGVRVRLTGKDEYHSGAPAKGNTVGGLNVNQLQAKLPEQGWFRRHWNAFKRTMSATN